MSARTTIGACGLALVLTTGAAGADEEPLLDYRDPAFAIGSPFYSQAGRRRIADALSQGPDGVGDEMGEDFAILGDADGAFTKSGAKERVYLVQSAAPVAIDPFPKGAAPLLLVMADDKPAGFFRLPPDVQYQRLVAAADGNADGRDEVLLEASFMNMGQATTALDVVAFDGDGEAKPIQTLEEVAHDGCDNPVGERTRSASTIYAGPDGFRAEKHVLDCGAK